MRSSDVFHLYTTEFSGWPFLSITVKTWELKNSGRQTVYFYSILCNYQWKNETHTFIRV
jgi:hypothetical protein